MEKAVYLNRDLSWLSFNGRVLLEAGKDTVPILERIKFLSIYSSNLDEFYRVRMPVLMAVEERQEDINLAGNYELAKMEINRQQHKFGEILSKQIRPALEEKGIHWLYNQSIPAHISAQVNDLFYTQILAYLHSERIDKNLTGFFAENNKLYQLVVLEDSNKIERLELINIPSDVIPRLYSIHVTEGTFVLFLEDIMKNNLVHLFPGDVVKSVYNLKVTRDAELNVEEISGEEITSALERQLERRDLGLATRLLCEPGIPLRSLYRVIYALNLQKAGIVEGGSYHNLKDLNGFPLDGAEFSYAKWPAVSGMRILDNTTLFESILKQDILINVPYQRYDPVLRFFNEAATDPSVEEIYVTLYRVATNSIIVSALSTAAKNGKKVTAMVELKARFDEANNIKWAKRMKAAGVRIIYSSLDLKVHAKVALVKRRIAEKIQYLGMLATGNLNETTAKFYTDHILLTAHQPMLIELELLFGFLSKKKKVPAAEDQINFEHLLVAQFNLKNKFLSLVQREIDHAAQGFPAEITIKMNNLEERVLISKLYEASQAGVKIKLIVRGICCLIPGVAGLSENIEVLRIVGRYLEHGRIFIFHNNGDEAIFMGSADWMNRNIYSRIEVCFPVYDPRVKQMLLEIVNLQQDDTAQQAIYLFLHQQNVLQT